VTKAFFTNNQSGLMNEVFVQLSFEPKTPGELMNKLANPDGVRVSYPYRKKFLGSGFSIDLNTTMIEQSNKRRYVVLIHEHFKTLYDRELRMPLVTYANFDYTKRRETALSEERQFSYDPLLPEAEQIGPSFYEKDEFDKGHMVRRASIDWGSTQEEALSAQLQSDYYTNIVAQYANFNRIVWKSVETECSELARKHGKIIEITGVWISDIKKYDSNRDNSDKRVVADAFWKCCVFPSTSVPTECFFVPHSGSIGKDFDVNLFRVTLKQLNEKLGYDISGRWKFFK
jgi:endonuclease G